MLGTPVLGNSPSCVCVCREGEGEGRGEREERGRGEGEGRGGRERGKGGEGRGEGKGRRGGEESGTRRAVPIRSRAWLRLSIVKDTMTAKLS